jgi:hypothetical protein
MPIGAQDSLDNLYALQHLLQSETARLELERDGLEPDPAEANRAYILAIQIRALREEFTRISSRISDLLERDLER